MSIADVKPYFRSRMNELGFKEWDDPFNFQNIPETMLDKSYHLSLGVTTQLSHNQKDLVLNVPVTVRLFFRGYNKPGVAYDKAADLSNSIIMAALDPELRTTQTTGVKNVQLANSEIIALDTSNDNSMYVEQQYNVMVIICP